MTETYQRMQDLYRAGRDSIWPYVLNNLVKPLWLSRDNQLADVLVGNPPWIAYRHLSAELQRRLKEASQRMNLWVGGVLSTQQDMCALFTARAAQRYLKPGGTIAFVLPYAVLNRPAYAGLRRGDCRDVALRWDEAWSLDETVRPLFPVPASVLIGRRAVSGPLPPVVRRFSGSLPRRDASEPEADRALTVTAAAPWPPMPTLAGASPYRARFKQGATIVPRRFWFVERESAGRLGASAAAPVVRGKVGAQDKAPWKNLEPPRGPVEAEFLRPVLLGESLAPFRVLEPALGVVPLDERGNVMDAAAAQRAGKTRLARWLSECETLWAEHASRTTDGTPRMALSESLDHMRKLSGQHPPAEVCVAYAASGTLPAAVSVLHPGTIVEHAAYWARARSIAEARYLTALLNSERVRLQIAPIQPKGQGGARHFDNLMWELPIPEFDARDGLHQELVVAAAECEAVATAVPLNAGTYFTQQRKAIRDALADAGLSARIDALIARLPGL